MLDLPGARQGLRYSLDNCLTEAARQAVEAECGCDFFVEQRSHTAHDISCYAENYTCFRK